MTYQPCVGCGWCCLTDQCTDSHRRYGYMRRCPDIFWSADRHRYLCRLMTKQVEGKDIRRSQHAGKGCCAPLNAWRKDVRNRDGD